MVRAVLLCVAVALLAAATALPLANNETSGDHRGNVHDPEYWFLSQEEIDIAMGGFNRSRGIHVYTKNNAIDILHDGAAFMEAVMNDISATKKGDFLHIAPYHMDNRLLLKPDVKHLINTEDSNLEKLLRNTIERGVDLRILVNDWNYFWAPKSMLFGFHDIPMTSDKRYPFMGSHHQKTMIVGHDNETFAFVGGLDFAPDRWDTPQHNLSNPNKKMEVGGDQIMWHDMAVRIRGDAVRDVERNFWERWNAPDDPSLTTPVPPKPFQEFSVQVANNPGTLNVQLLRTFPCIYGNYNFAPKGEITILHAMLKAISQARDYIYLETPYITSMDIAHAIANALPNVNGVIIGTVPCRMAQKMEEKMKQTDDNDSDGDLSMFIERQFIGGLDYYAKQFLKIITSVPGQEHKVQAYVTKNPENDRYIYMHAKVLIVDDTFSIIGSQNINRRSMTHDSELSIAVVDDVIDNNGRHAFARDLRKRLWGEHLGLPTDSPILTNFTSGAAEWKRQADLGTMRPRPFRTHDVEVDPLQDLLSSDDVWGVWDPEGRCNNPGVMTKDHIQSLLSTNIDQLMHKETRARAARAAASA